METVTNDYQYRNVHMLRLETRVKGTATILHEGYTEPSPDKENGLS